MGGNGNEEVTKFLIGLLIHVTLFEIRNYFWKYFILGSLVLDEPSNASMIEHYEKRAKNHLDNYMNLLLRDPNRNEFEMPSLIGNRQSKDLISKKDAHKIPQEVAFHFFENLIQSFHDFKDYCSENDSSECAILETDNDKFILAKALNDYDKIFFQDL